MGSITVSYTKAKSKMKDIHYAELSMQKYLELKEMTARQAKVWFKFRVRMTPLVKTLEGENRQLCALSAPCTRIVKLTVFIL